MKIKSIQYILWFFLIVLMFTSCSKKESKNGEIVARVGNIPIEWKELYQSFYLEPAWAKGMSYWDAYMNQLQFLIDRKLFALEFKKDHQNLSDDLTKTLEFIKEKEMVKALYKKHILDKIKLDSNDYKTAYFRSKRKIQLEYIKSPFKENLEQYRSLLQQKGIDQIQLKNPAVEEKGRTPMFTFGDMDEKVEDVAFALHPFEVSQIIKVDDVYLILKLVDGKTVKFASKTELAMQKPSLRKILLDRKARPLSRAYINKLMDGVHIHIDPHLFNELFSVIESQVQGKVNDSPLQNPISSKEFNLISKDLSNFFEKPLATYDGKTMTIKSFLDFYRIIPDQIRPPIHRPVLLRDAIVKFIEFEYLKKEAYKEGLDKNPLVLKNVRIQQDKIRAFHYLKEVKKSISATEEQLEKFKQSEKAKRLKKVMGNAANDEAFKRYLETEMFTEQVVKLADSLRNLYSVEIYQPVLKKFIKDSSATLEYDPVAFNYKERFF